MTLLLLVLAVCRVTRLVTSDLIAERPRRWLVRRGGMLGELVCCDWCASVWVSAGMVGVSVLAGVHVPVPVLSGAAASWVAGLSGELLDRGKP